jgi:peptide/nickel transport system substrate-binding protein
MSAPRGIDRHTFLKRTGAVGAAIAAGGLGPVLNGGVQDIAHAASAVTPSRGGKITLAIVDQPVNMDAADGELYSSIEVYDNIFSKLINVTKDFRFVPNLATKWTQDDPYTWTLDLVDNAVFHNNEPFTANDVKFTFDRLPTHADGIFFAAFKRTEVLNKHRVRFHLSHPFGPFEASLAAFSEIMNKKAVTSANPKLNPVGTGPYKLKNWVQNDHVTLTRWYKYFKPNKPYLDEVTFRGIGDDTVRLTGLQTGELNWIQQVPAQQATSLLSSSQIKTSPGRPYFPYFILLNCTRPPFNDKRVRQAIAWCIDREQFAKILWFGTSVTATEAVSPPDPWYSGVDPYKGAPDPERAKALLKQAGRTNLHITYLGQPNVVSQERTGEILKSQLAKAGITMDIQNYAPAQYFEQFGAHKYDITSTYWSATLDPAHLYFPLCYSPSIWNFPGIRSAAINAALERFVYTTDLKKRKAAYPEVVRTVAEEAPVIFLTNQIQRYSMQPNVYGSEPLPSLEIRLEDMWLKR